MMDLLILLAVLVVTVAGSLFVARRPGLYCWLDGGHAPTKLDDGSVVCGRCRDLLSPAAKPDPEPLYWCQDCRRATHSVRGACRHCASRSIVPFRVHRLRRDGLRPGVRR